MNVRRSQDDQAKFARLREVWERRASIWDVDCLAYLKTRRIEQGDLLDNDSIDLAWHHGLPCDGNVAPCLLARYRHNSESFASSKLVTIQRIWPSLGEKRVMPSPIKMNGVFCPLGGWPEDTLGVAEGIITALSARVVMGSMGRHIPVWACYSAEQMMRFVPPPSIKSLFVFMDVDKSFAGQAAAYELARKLAVSHPQITVSLRRSFPGEHVDRDFNDFLVLMRNKEERSHG